MKRGKDKMKATMRMGKGSAEHNTHLHEAEHIDNERTDKNIYWTYKHGFTEKENLIKDEALFYEENYAEYLDKQNSKYRQRRQYAKIKNMEEYQKATPLDEMILQIGKKEETVNPEILKSVTDEFIKELEKKYGKNIHVVSYAIHLDEATPHVHLRIAFDYVNKDNIKQYGIDKALTALGFKKPNANKKEDKWNNKKISFTDRIRSIFYDLCDLHLLDKGYDLINRTVENPSHRHLKTELFKAKMQQDANERMKIENDVLEKAIYQAIQDLEDLKKKNGTAAADADELRSQVSSAKKELEDLKTERDEVKNDLNKKIDHLNECVKILYDAEDLDIKRLGYSPLTKSNDELQKRIQTVDKMYR